MFQRSARSPDHSLLNSLSDRALRAGIAATFLLFGMEKLFADPGSLWVRLFALIGAGPWFREFTAIVEVAGAILLLTSRTVLAGLALLGSAMAGAILILVFVLHRPGNAFLASCILIALIWSDPVNVCTSVGLFLLLSLLLPSIENRASGSRGRFERRLISLIFAGRNRIILIRRELPLTNGASQAEPVA